MSVSKELKPCAVKAAPRCSRSVPQRTRSAASPSLAHHDVPNCELARFRAISAVSAPPMGESSGVGME